MVEAAYIDDLQVHPPSANGIGLTALDGMGSPVPRAVSDLRPSDHGATDATQFYGPRNVALIGNVRADSKAALWPIVDQLKAKLRLGSIHTFKFRREGLDYDEQMYVRVDSTVDVPLGLMPSPFVTFGVTLFAADPRIYSTTLVSGTYDPTDSGLGGLSFPLDFPLDFDVADGSAQLSVDNEGTISSPPVITITGPVTNPIVDNDTSSMSVYTQNLALTAGSSLVLDMAARTVTLDGVSRPDLIDVSLTDWFYIEPGVNLLRLRGSDMASGQTTLSVAFHSARI